MSTDDKCRHGLSVENPCWECDEERGCSLAPPTGSTKRHELMMLILLPLAILIQVARRIWSNRVDSQNPQHKDKTHMNTNNTNDSVESLRYKVELLTQRVEDHEDQLRKAYSTIQAFVNAKPAQMSTPLGLLPINADGMRQLVDALDKTQGELELLKWRGF